MRKGFDLALAAWRLAQPDGLHLLWVGDLDTNTRALLREKLAEAQAAGTFHHLPFCTDAADLLTAADVHILASREDPFPSVVLEAMSAGVSTVAFAGGGGAPALLREMDAGVAVPMEDVAAMARQAVRLARGGSTGQARLAATTRRRFAFDAYAIRLLALVRPDIAPISVVIPSHNYARHMPSRLGSVLAQSYPVLEVVVLDDASTDDSVGVAREVAAAAGRHVRVVEGRRASGSVFRQWARAARLARGEWLWIAEADDSCAPDMLARLAAAAQAAPDTVLAFCDSQAVDAEGAVLWADHQAYYDEIERGALAADLRAPGREFLARLMSERNAILNVSAVLWRRTALLAALGRCEAELAGYRIAGDWRLYAEVLAEGGSVAYVADPLNAHCRHGASATHRLDGAHHVAEIARVQAWIAQRLGASAALGGRQKLYRDRIAAQLMVRPAAE